MLLHRRAHRLSTPQRSRLPPVQPEPDRKDGLTKKPKRE
jgi:hypothetical protein